MATHRRGFLHGLVGIPGLASLLNWLTPRAWADAPPRDVYRELGVKPLINAAHAKIPPVSGHFWVKAVGTMFNHAITQLDYEGRNPARGLDTTPPKARQRVLTDAELASFLARAKALGDHWYSFFYVLAHTGARSATSCV